MNKLVILSVGDGNWGNGFPAVAVRLWESGSSLPMQFRGSLPAAPEIPELYRAWQLLYAALYRRLSWHTRIKIVAGDVTNVSEVEFNGLCQRLSAAINAWLNSEPFRPVDQQLRARLALSDEIRFVIETDDPLLRRLPWHLWNFFGHYPKAEVALSALEYQSPEDRMAPLTNEVRILAILGNSTGIDVQQDRAVLERLPDAETTFLVEPQRQRLNHQLWEQPWDILFFAGHSSSQADGETGRIYINQTDSLSIDQLKYGLKKAVERGLKLAIFNSCDGLGLARDLADLNIPQLIVMREPVADRVAQEFLKSFLEAFARGESFYLAVREARERLQGLEDQFPCATWLPVICQNPTEVPPTWHEWCVPKEHNDSRSIHCFSAQDPPLTPVNAHRQTSLSGRSLRTVLLTSAVIGTLLIGAQQKALAPLLWPPNRPQATTTTESTATPNSQTTAPTPTLPRSDPTTNPAVAGPPAPRLGPAANPPGAGSPPPGTSRISSPIPGSGSNPGIRRPPAPESPSPKPEPPSPKPEPPPSPTNPSSEDGDVCTEYDEQGNGNCIHWSSCLDPDRRDLPGCPSN